MQETAAAGRCRFRYPSEDEQPAAVAVLLVFALDNGEIRVVLVGAVARRAFPLDLALDGLRPRQGGLPKPRGQKLELCSARKAAEAKQRGVPVDVCAHCLQELAPRLRVAAAPIDDAPFWPGRKCDPTVGALGSFLPRLFVALEEEGGWRAGRELGPVLQHPGDHPGRRGVVELFYGLYDPLRIHACEH